MTTTTTVTAVFALTTFLAVIPAARADLVTQLPSDTNQTVNIRTGLDSSVALIAGYTYRLRPQKWGHDVLVFARLTLPRGGASLGDNSAHLGVRTTALAHGNLRLQMSMGPMIINQTNKLFSARALGAHATLLPGYQSKRWGLMAELGYEKVLATKLHHSDLYKNQFYQDANDGWYSATAGTVRLGLRGGARIGRIQLSARFGKISTEKGKPHIPPFYGSIGVGYAF